MLTNVDAMQPLVGSLDIRQVFVIASSGAFASGVSPSRWMSGMAKQRGQRIPGEGANFPRQSRRSPPRAASSQGNRVAGAMRCQHCQSKHLLMRELPQVRHAREMSRRAASATRWQPQWTDEARMRRNYRARDVDRGFQPPASSCQLGSDPLRATSVRNTAKTAARSNNVRSWKLASC